MYYEDHYLKIHIYTHIHTCIYTQSYVALIFYTFSHSSPYFKIRLINFVQWMGKFHVMLDRMSVKKCRFYLLANMFHNGWVFLFQTVGCDGVVGSGAKTDVCGECRGDNSTCKMIRGEFTQQPHQNSRSFLYSTAAVIKFFIHHYFVSFLCLFT